MAKKRKAKDLSVKKEHLIKNVTVYVCYLFIVWGLYRSLFKLPDEIEELFVKPVIWLGPLLFLLSKERSGLSTLGITTRNLFPSVYYALILGVIFAFEGFLINILKYRGGDFSANIGNNPLLIGLGLSFATAVSEEIAFRGYVFGRVKSIIGNEWVANTLVSITWALIHLPITVFWWKLTGSETFGYLILTTIFGFGSAFVYARTGNIMSSILLHVMWQWPIALFR